jgi:hypothetical protein
MERYIPKDVNAAMTHLRTYVAQYAQGTWRMERVVIMGGRGVVPHSELAMHCRVAGKEIYAAAIVYADHQRDDATGTVSDYLHAAYAYVLTIDGRFVDGLHNDVTSWACREQAGEKVRRHDYFEWLDGHWYITKTGWKNTHSDYRGVVDGQKSLLVNGGGRGTMLVPITVLKDNEHPPRIVTPPAVRTA